MRTPTTDLDLGPRCYRIIRHYYAGHRRTIRNHVSLKDAQLHCTSPYTIVKGHYFDCYDYMRGCAPKGGDR